MPFAALLVTLLAPAVAPMGPLASTYDQATCAAVHTGDDDWAQSAIGEDAPATPTAVDCTPVVTDCEAVAFMTVDLIGTCDMPHANLARPGLRAARDARRVPKPLVELATTDQAAPLAPPPPDRESSPALTTRAPTLDVPTRYTLLAIRASHTPRSVGGDTLLRPPQA